MLQPGRLAVTSRHFRQQLKGSLCLQRRPKLGEPCMKPVSVNPRQRTEVGTLSFSTLSLAAHRLVVKPRGPFFFFFFLPSPYLTTQKRLAQLTPPFLNTSSLSMKQQPLVSSYLYGTLSLSLPHSTAKLFNVKGCQGPDVGQFYLHFARCPAMTSPTASISF